MTLNLNFQEVSKESEYNVKNHLAALGFSKFIQWSAWFAKSLSLNMFGVTIVTLFLTVV